MDVNRQTWAAQTNLIVHPVGLYVGLRSATPTSSKGRPAGYDVIVTDVDGNVAEGKAATVRSVRLAWAFENGEWVQQRVDEQVCGSPRPPSRSRAASQRPKAANIASPPRCVTRPAAEPDRRHRVGERRARWCHRAIWSSRAWCWCPTRRTTRRATPPACWCRRPCRRSGLLTVAQQHPLHRELFTRRRHRHAGIPTRTATAQRQHQVDVNGSAPRLDDKGKPVGGRRPSRLRHRQPVAQHPAAEPHAGWRSHPTPRVSIRAPPPA